MNSSIKKLKDRLHVDLTLKEDLLRGGHGLDEEEGQLVRSLIDDGSSSYIATDAVRAKNILKKLSSVHPEHAAYVEARKLAAAGTGNLLPIPLDENLLETLLSEFKGRDHHRGTISIAAKLDISNEMLLTGTWNGVSHYGIDMAVEGALGFAPELIKLSLEHAEGGDEVRVVHFEPSAVLPFKCFGWFGGSLDENTFILSKSQAASRRDTRLTLLHERGLGMKGIGFLGALAREFPETKILFCTRGSEVEVSKSAIALMTMPLKAGDEVRIVAAGPNAHDVIERVENSSPGLPIFLKAENAPRPTRPSVVRSVELKVNEERGVHFRVIGSLLNIARRYMGTSLYLNLDGTDRIDLSMSFTRLCIMGIPSGKILRFTAEGPDAAKVIDSLIELKLDAKNNVFSPYESGRKKGSSGDDDPEGGASPASGENSPAAGDSGTAPPESFSGITRGFGSNSAQAQPDSLEVAWLPTPLSVTPVADRFILGATAFAATAVTTM